jgi:AcrR family transcriptional regulator
MAPSTAELLIVTAERLYGEHGVDAVSLRQIAEAAGQRNPAVVQYHFGTKEGLLRAIVEYRVQAANARRHAMLDEVERSGSVLDLHALLEAAVFPLLHEQPQDSRYLQFVARLPHSRAALAPIFGEMGDEYGGSAARIGIYLDQALADLPPPIRANRLSVAFDALLRALADHQQRAENGLPELLPWDLFVDDLILCVESFLRAPLPPSAAERLTLTPTGTNRSPR